MIRAEDSVLIVVDVQGKLAEVMCDREALFANIKRLAGSARAVGVPVWVTEQLPDKLGATRPELSEALEGFPVMVKSSFSCCGAPAWRESLVSSKKRQLILCGIEAHICVAQTALELLEQGFEVYLVADAVASRSVDNKRLAIERMRQHGADVVPTESVLFEWLRDAQHPAFRTVRTWLS